jgi:hypothetical protein
MALRPNVSEKGPDSKEPQANPIRKRPLIEVEKLVEKKIVTEEYEGRMVYLLRAIQRPQIFGSIRYIP